MTEKETSADARLEAVQKEIESWRRNRPKLGPMPEEQWAGAIALARELGVSRVAGVLGMNHGALSRRVDPSKVVGPKRTKQTALSKFVEVTQAPAAKPSTVIELTSATGERLTIRVNQSVDLSALVAHFQARQ